MMNPRMKLIKKQRKLDKLIEIQKKQNEYDAKLKLKQLHLRNSLLYPSNTRRSSFSSATASSQAKKRRVLTPPTNQKKNSKSKQRRASLSKSKGFVSHYDRLKKCRKTQTQKRPSTQSMIKIQQNIDKSNSNILNSSINRNISKNTSKTSKKQIQKRSTTIPKAPRFATSNRMQNRREWLIQQRAEQRELAEIERLKKLKKEKLESQKRLKTMRKTIKKKQQQFLSSQYSTPLISKVRRNRNQNRQRQRNETDSIRKRSQSMVEKPLKRSRSQPHFMNNTKSKSLRLRARSFKSEPESDDIYVFEKQQNGDDNIKGLKQSVSRSRSVGKIQGTNISALATNKDLDGELIKELNDIKEKLRFGKQINIPRSRSLERIQSRYAQRKDNDTRSRKKRSGISVVIPVIPPLEIENDAKILEDIELREKEMNKRLLLTPIHEIDNNLEDLAIDEILTEDACTISDHYQVNEEKKEESTSLEVDLLMDEARQFVFSPLKVNTKSKGDGDITNNYLEDKFKKLDNLFIEIAEKIESYDDCSSSFDFN